MKKQVNVFASVPVVTIENPFSGYIRNVTMDSDDIRKCLFAKAKVEEILPSGKTVKLDFTNYDKENTTPSSDKVTNDVQRPTVTPQQAQAANATTTATAKLADTKTATDDTKKTDDKSATTDASKDADTTKKGK